MTYKDVYTQEELEKAIAESFVPVCRGDGEFVATDQSQVTATDQSQVRAYDQSQVRATGQSQVTATDQSQVTATDQSQVRAYDQSQVTAYGQSQVRAYDQSQVRATGQSQVRAYDQSQVRAYDQSQVTATGQSQVTATDHSQVTASPYVAVTITPGSSAKVTGGVQINPPPVKTAEEWCEYYGVEVNDGVAVLYKAVDADYMTDRSRPANISYAPGSKPVAPDWDGGKEECGGGLHFCPTPVHALSFNGSASHYIACPVRVEDIAVHFPAQFPEKVKAPGCAAPVYEVDINGNRLEAK